MTIAKQDIPIRVYDRPPPGAPGAPCPSVCPPGQRGARGLKGLRGDPGQWSYALESGNAIIPGRGCLYIGGLTARDIFAGQAMYSGRFFSVQIQYGEGGTGLFQFDLDGRPSWLNWNAKYRIASGNVPSNAMGQEIILTHKVTDLLTGEVATNQLEKYTVGDGTDSQTGGTSNTYFYDGEINRFYVLAGQAFSFTIPKPIFIGFGRNTNPAAGNAQAVEFASSLTSSSFGKNLALDVNGSLTESGGQATISGTAPTYEQILAAGRADRTSDDFFSQDFQVYVTGHAGRSFYQYQGTIYVVNPISLDAEASPQTVQRSSTGAGGAGDLTPIRPRSAIKGGERGRRDAIELFATKVPMGTTLESICTNARRRIEFDNTSRESQPEPGTYSYTVDVVDPRIANPAIENMATREYQFIIPPRRG